MRRDSHDALIQYTDNIFHTSVGYKVFKMQQKLMDSQLSKTK